jgi:Predicted glycosyltransferases
MTGKFETHRALDAEGRLTDQLAHTTVVFTAHNRRELVLDAIGYALRQTIPVHVIVADDASSDGTEEAVRDRYPGVTYLRSAVSRGPCYQRNVGVEIASTEFVFPLDDDSMLVDPDTLRIALADFGAPEIAIVCMPFTNVLKDAIVHHGDAGKGGAMPLDFAACAHAVRREAFLSVGGYNEDLFYTMEEGDLALRLFDSGGWRTVHGTSPVLHHMQKVGKISYIQDYTGTRNKVLFYYRYAPARYVLQRILGASVLDGIHQAKRLRIGPWISGIRDGLWQVVSGKAKRTPVTLASFRAYLAQRR